MQVDKNLYRFLLPFTVLTVINLIWHLALLEEVWGWKSTVFVSSRVLIYLYIGVLCWQNKWKARSAFLTGVTVLMAEAIFGAVLFGLEGSIEAAYGLIISSLIFSFVSGIVTLIGYWIGKLIISPHKQSTA